MAPPSLIIPVLIVLAAFIHSSKSFYYGNKYNKYMQQYTKGNLLYYDTNTVKPSYNQYNYYQPDRNFKQEQQSYGSPIKRSSYDVPIYYLPGLKNVEETEVEENVITNDILETVKRILLEEEIRENDYYSHLERVPKDKRQIVGIVFDPPKKAPRVRNFFLNY